MEDLNSIFTRQFEFLRSIHDIEWADFKLLADEFKQKDFKKGENISEPGKTDSRLYLTISGVQMYYFDTDAKINILGFVSAPNFCVIPASFFFQRPSKYYLTCLTDSSMSYITYDSLQKVFDHSQSVERLFRKLSESVIAGLIDRQIELRSTTIEERYREFCKRSAHLLQLIPHKYIASYLAIDATNFSKLYNSIKI